MLQKHGIHKALKCKALKIQAIQLDSKNV